jgi:hypothetical protein
MRVIRIIERPNETYAFAAVDQQTGEVPLRLADRDALVALCRRLGWTVHGEREKSSGEVPAGVEVRRKQRRWGRVRTRVGGGTKFISARKRPPHARRAAAEQR